MPYFPPAGGGDAVGPASSTDNAVTRFDSTTGKLLQDSVATIDDTGNMIVGVGSATAAIYLGGTTSAFIKIRRVGTSFYFMLGDESTYAGALLSTVYLSAPTTGVVLGAHGRLFSISNGVLSLTDEALTSFNRLLLGPSSASFPAIGQVATTGGWGVKFPSAINTNGQAVNLQQITELTTIAAAATTDTTIQIPVGAIVIGVSVRVTVAIPTATTFDVGVAGATTRYGTALSVNVNTTNAGTEDGMRFYGSAIEVRFTPNGTPASNAGRVRTTIHFLSVTPPTS